MRVHKEAVQEAEGGGTQEEDAGKEVEEPVVEVQGDAELVGILQLIPPAKGALEGQGSTAAAAAAAAVAAAATTAMAEAAAGSGEAGVISGLAVGSTALCWRPSGDCLAVAAADGLSGCWLLLFGADLELQHECCWHSTIGNPARGAVFKSL